MHVAYEQQISSQTKRTQFPEDTDNMDKELDRL